MKLACLQKKILEFNLKADADQLDINFSLV